MNGDKNMKLLRHWLLFMTPEDLKSWRELTGYSQMKLAAALRVSRVTVTRWETGVRGIPSFLGLALAGLEAIDAEKKSGETKTKKEVKGNAKG
jgi:transcriptional regulator with XRE-family HTH domain